VIPSGAKAQPLYQPFTDGLKAVPFEESDLIRASLGQVVSVLAVTINVQAVCLHLLSPMKCPFCSFENDKVVDSRESKEGESIRRRRECLKCERRFTTYERIDEIPYMVVKKDGRREKFERQKVLNGLLRACEKRPVSMSKLEQIVNDAEGFVVDSPDRERKTSEVGELIMNRLKRIDKVAYVRFASVYLDFKDVREFMAELKELLDTKDNASAKAKTGD
jgi:transcriptional repressor NrdR